MAKLQVPPENSYFKVKDQVYRVKRVSVGQDKLWLRDLTTGEIVTTVFSVFMAGATRVLSVGEIAQLLNRTRRAMLLYEDRGIIKPAMRCRDKRGQEWRFYTIEDAIEIRDDLASIHMGRPRNDGEIINNRTIDKGNLLKILRERYDYSR